MNITPRLLLMAYAASSFFEDYEFKEGDCFGARIHTCDNEVYKNSVLHWKEVAHARKGYQRVMTEEGADLTYGISMGDGDTNRVMGCGHKAFDKIFPIFRVDEIFEMLNKHDPEKWDMTRPLNVFLKTANSGYNLPINTLNVVKSLEELMLAFYMLDVHKMIWIENSSKWIPGAK